MWAWMLISGAWAGENMFGGRIVKDPQLYLHAGYPSTEIGVHVPLGTSFELTPWARFRFAEGLDVAELGSGAGLDMRVPLLNDKKLQGALWFSVGGEVRFFPGAPWGEVHLGHPGWLMTWRATDELDLDFGIRFEASLWLNEGLPAFFRGAVPLFVGVEFAVTPTIQLGFRVESGPAFVGEVLYPDVSALFFVGWTL